MRDQARRVNKIRVVPWPDGSETTVEPLEDGRVRVIYRSVNGDRETDNTYDQVSSPAQARGHALLAAAMNWATVQAQEAQEAKGDSHGGLHEER